MSVISVLSIIAMVLCAVICVASFVVAGYYMSKNRTRRSQGISETLLSISTGAAVWFIVPYTIGLVASIL